MALPQASLGSMPSISLGGYIPAARRDPSVFEQALAAFLGGAAGTAGNRLVDKALPDPQRVAADKLARDRMAAEAAQHTASLDVAKDSNTIRREQLAAGTAESTAERGSREAIEKARREAQEVQAWRDSQALNTRMLGQNALEQSRIESEGAQRGESMKLRAAQEETAARERAEDRAIRAPVLQQQARLYGTQADIMRDEAFRASPEGRQAAIAQTLGLSTPQSTPNTNLDLDELARIQQEPQPSQGFIEQAGSLGISPVAEGVASGVQAVGDKVEQNVALAKLLARFLVPGQVNQTNP